MRAVSTWCSWKRAIERGRYLVALLVELIIAYLLVPRVSGGLMLAAIQYLCATCGIKCGFSIRWG
jgi:hypothetical protein